MLLLCVWMVSILRTIQYNYCLCQTANDKYAGIFSGVCLCVYCVCIIMCVLVCACVCVCVCAPQLHESAAKSPQYLLCVLTLPQGCVCVRPNCINQLLNPLNVCSVCWHFLRAVCVTSTPASGSQEAPHEMQISMAADGISPLFKYVTKLPQRGLQKEAAGGLRGKKEQE